jgi:phosphoglycolate phosphatase
MTQGAIRAVLFDLDGTLVDSAPDLAGAVNFMRSQRGLPALPIEVLRPWASHGARGLLGAGLNISPEDAEFTARRDEFLNHYEKTLADNTRVFPAMEPILRELEARQLKWGIVTNKHMRFTDPLCQALGLTQRAAIVVSGDTTPHAKPHPAPLLHAAEKIGVSPEQCLYVGDDLRDVQAGQAAGMKTVVVTYGYCGGDLPPAQWGGDYLIHTPQELLGLL